MLEFFPRALEFFSNTLKFWRFRVSFFEKMTVLVENRLKMHQIWLLAHFARLEAPFAHLQQMCWKKISFEKDVTTDDNSESWQENRIAVSCSFFDLQTSLFYKRKIHVCWKNTCELKNLSVGQRMNKIQRFGFLVMIRNYRRTPVTAVGLDVFEELSTTYEFLVSKAPSGTNLKTKDSHIS